MRTRTELRPALGVLRTSSHNDQQISLLVLSHVGCHVYFIYQVKKYENDALFEFSL